VQVKRGEAYVKQLNRFAHSVDQERESLNLGEQVTMVVGLCERFARLRKVQLESHLPETAQMLEANAFDLLQLVYRGLELCLAASQAGSTIRVSCQSGDTGARLMLQGENPPEAPEELQERCDFIATLAVTMGVGVELSCAAGQPVCVVMDLPPSLAAAGE
jgi:hypothetical protein